MSNSLASSLKERLIGVETERRANAEDRRGIYAEMKKLEKHERKGILLAVKWHFETAEQAQVRQMSFDFAEALTATRVRQAA